MSDDNKIPGKRRRRCEICNCLKYGVFKDVNPYDEDIHGEENVQTICEECYKNLQDDI